MPHIDGLTLLRTVKAQKRGVPVVIMSAETDRSIVEQLLAESAGDVIPKPFDRIEFAGIVTSTLRRRRLARRGSHHTFTDSYRRARLMFGVSLDIRAGRREFGPVIDYAFAHIR